MQVFLMCVCVYITLPQLPLYIYNDILYIHDQTVFSSVSSIRGVKLPTPLT